MCARGIDIILLDLLDFPTLADHGLIPYRYLCLLVHIYKDRTVFWIGFNLIFSAAQIKKFYMLYVSFILLFTLSERNIPYTYTSGEENDYHRSLGNLARYQPRKITSYRGIWAGSV